MFNRKRFLWGVILVLAVIATTTLTYFNALWPTAIRVAFEDKTHDRSEADESARLKTMLGGDAGLQTISHPDRVDAFRISDPMKDHTTFPIIGGPIRLSPSGSQSVSAALMSPKSYGWQYAKGCMPDFGVCLTFHRGRDRIDVLLCFSCDILLVAHNGVATGGEDFDPMHPVLVRTIKTLFPNDSAIQALSAKSCAAPAPEPAGNLQSNARYSSKCVTLPFST